MPMNALMQRWLGHGAPVKASYSLTDKILGFIDLTRPRLSLMTPLNAGSAAVLALRGYPPLTQCLVGSAAVVLSVAGTHAFNDFVDRRRDLAVWPGRPVPGGRVKAYQALLLALVSFGGALAISWIFFNPYNFAIFFLALALGCLYSAYLRDRVGYLSLPPINGLIYLGGWAAFAPEALFSSWLPWVLYSLGFYWQAAHIMIYSPVHPIRRAKEGWRTEVPALFFTPSPRGAVALGVGFLIVTLLLAVGLFFLAHLSLFYLALVLVVAVPTLASSLVFLRNPSDRDKGLKAFSQVSNFRLVLSAAILLDVLLFSGRVVAG